VELIRRRRKLFTRCCIPGVDERERGKVLRKSKIVISAKSTYRARYAHDAMPSLVLYLALSLPNDAAIGREPTFWLSEERNHYFSSRIVSHPHSAKRFPSRYYIRFRDESDYSRLKFTWKRKADFRVSAWFTWSLNSNIQGNINVIYVCE